MLANDPAGGGGVAGGERLARPQQMSKWRRSYFACGRRSADHSHASRQLVADYFAGSFNPVWPFPITLSSLTQTTISFAGPVSSFQLWIESTGSPLN